MPVIDIGLPTGFTSQKDDFEIVRNFLYLLVQYECFILRAVRLSNKLLGQGYVKEHLK